MSKFTVSEKLRYPFDGGLGGSDEADEGIGGGVGESVAEARVGLGCRGGGGRRRSRGRVNGGFSGFGFARR